MAIILKRQLNDEDKKIILARHGRKDWVTEREIPEGEPVHFDHIKPVSRGGRTELNNIAPLSKETNLAKGQLTLQEYRAKLQIEQFFEKGQRLTLGDLLDHLKESNRLKAFGQPVKITTNGGQITLQTDDLNTFTAPLQECPITGWKYFYLTLPVVVLDSDDDSDTELGLQPRYLILDKVFRLYRHFLNHPVLQPSIGRIEGQRIKLFDGQHKVAALLFNDRQDFELKIYCDAEKRLLNQTNIAAHDAFAQTRFYSSIMVMKLGAQFGRDFEEYRLENDGRKKSEANFLRWIQKKELSQPSDGDLRKRLRSFLYKSVLEDQNNKLSPFVSVENRSSKETPITMDQLQKSLFAEFLFREPLEDDMATESYKREDEFANVVMLMNMLYDNAMYRWNPSAPKQNQEQLALDRMFRSKSTMAWSEILKGAVCSILELHEDDERAKVFYRKLLPEQVTRIDRTVQRLTEWQGWIANNNSEIDRRLSDNESELRKWLRTQGLTTGYLLGADD